LRCPHCGGGAVLTWKGAVRARCSRCNLRFQRSDNNYFFGAVFFGLLLGEAIFAVSFGIMVIAMWPSVPWDTLTYGLPLGMIVVCALMVPISKVVWLAVDVLVRPVFPAELV
jgi:uncharacterized protein (DUF983 family)